MFRIAGRFELFAVIITALFVCRAFADDAAGVSQIVHCAAVGGLNEIDFWPQLADRFQRATGHRLEFVATGPKHAISAAFTSGEADVILMHNSDTIMNLV